MSAINTDCRKCKAPMPQIVAMDVHPDFTLTGYRCDKCDHWNDLKRRKPKTPKDQLKG